MFFTHAPTSQHPQNTPHCGCSGQLEQLSCCFLRPGFKALNPLGGALWYFRLGTMRNASRDRSKALTEYLDYVVCESRWLQSVEQEAAAAEEAAPTAEETSAPAEEGAAEQQADAETEHPEEATPETEPEAATKPAPEE